MVSILGDNIATLTVKKRPRFPKRGHEFPKKIMDTLTNTTESNNLIQLLKSRSFNVLKLDTKFHHLKS